MLGRFINADTYSSTGQGFLGYNMFAYCGNNPVQRNDECGSWWGEDAWNWLCETVEDAVEAVGEVVVDVTEGVVSVAKDIYNFVTNDDPTVCQNSTVSMYKGTLVFNVNWKWAEHKLTSFSFGVVVMLNEQNKEPDVYENTLRHEYGHSVQFRLLGPAKYTAKIALPSIVYNLLARNSEKLSDMYYSMPWERSADAFGRVTSRKYPFDKDGYYSYLYLY